MPTHDILTAVNNVLTLYGRGKPVKLVEDDVTQGQWWVLFEDWYGRKLPGTRGWTAEFEGTYRECLDFIIAYNAPADRPF